MAERDVLQAIPLSELPLLIELLQRRVGRADSTFVVNCIKNAIDWLTRYPGDSYVKVLAPNGDWKSYCTFICDFGMPNASSLVIFTLEESNEQLIDCLLRTKTIDWNRNLLFAMVAEKNYPVVYRLAKEGYVVLDEHNPPCYIFRIDSEKALEFDCTCPENTRVNKLDISHADLVNSEWPHKYNGSEKYMETIIARNDSVGLFIEDTGELASWAFVNFLGALASLQTMPLHKRKGFGTLIAKVMSARMAAIGMDPYGTVLTCNEASKKLFYSLGFKPQAQEGTFFSCQGRRS